MLGSNSRLSEARISVRSSVWLGRSVPGILGACSDGRHIVLTKGAIARSCVMAWLFAKKANDRAVTADWDKMWTGAGVVVIFHLVVISAASTLYSALW